MDPEQRTVRRDDAARVWIILLGGDPERPLSFSTKALAVAKATAQLRDTQRGGQLTVYKMDGTLDFTSFVAGSGNIRATGQTDLSLGNVQHQIERDGERIDKSLDIGTKVLAVLTLIGVPVSGLMSSDVEAAAGEGWLAVVLTTFTWSVGCTLAAICINRSGLTGWPLAGAVLLCYVVALGLANLVGTGVLDVKAESFEERNPLTSILVFLEVAIRTYGPVGAALGLGLGTWLGIRLSPLVGKDFAL